MAPRQFPVVSRVFEGVKTTKKISVRQDPLIPAVMRILTKVLGERLLGVVLVRRVIINTSLPSLKLVPYYWLYCLW